MQLVIDRDKWINHVINLEGKLKYYLKVLKTDDKISEKEYGNPEVHKAVIHNTPKFQLVLSIMITLRVC